MRRCDKQAHRNDMLDIPSQTKFCACHVWFVFDMISSREIKVVFILHMLSLPLSLLYITSCPKPNPRCFHQTFIPLYKYSNPPSPIPILIHGRHIPPHLAILDSTVSCQGWCPGLASNSKGTEGGGTRLVFELVAG